MTPAEEFAKEIQDESGVTEKHDLAFVAAVIWFEGASVWKQMELVPNNRALRIFLMFHDSEEVRVYALPASDPVGDEKPVPPVRYTLSKRAPIQVSESMSRNAFKREIVIELRVAAGLDDEDETIDCDKCGEENPITAAYCNACGEAIPDDEPVIAPLKAVPPPSPSPS